MLATSASFANTPTLENEIEVKNENQIEKTLVCIEEENEEDTVCSVSCSMTLEDGTTVSATGGNWFSSCERATRRCLEKMVAQVE